MSHLSPYQLHTHPYQWALLLELWGGPKLPFRAIVWMITWHKNIDICGEHCKSKCSIATIATWWCVLWAVLCVWVYLCHGLVAQLVQLTSEVVQVVAEGVMEGVGMGVGCWPPFFSSLWKVWLGKNEDLNLSNRHIHNHQGTNIWGKYLLILYFYISSSSYLFIQLLVL